VYWLLRTRPHFHIQEQIELELKTYYLGMCTSKDARINELESSNESLRQKLFESKSTSIISGFVQSRDAVRENPVAPSSERALAEQYEQCNTRERSSNTANAELSEEIAQLRNDNARLHAINIKLNARLECCQCSQLSSTQQQLRALLAEKECVQQRLKATEAELKVSKDDLESATSALLDQAESQICRCCCNSNTFSGKDDLIPYEDGLGGGHTRQTVVDALSLKDYNSNFGRFHDIIETLREELIAVEVFHDDELKLFEHAAKDQLGRVSMLTNENGLEVSPHSFSLATETKPPTILFAQFNNDVSNLDHLFLKAQRQAFLLEIERNGCKKHLATSEKIWSEQMKQIEEDRDGLKNELLSLRSDLKDMEQRLGESIARSEQALFHSRRRSLLFDVEKRGWTFDKNRIQGALRDSIEAFDCLRRSHAAMSCELSKRDRDRAESCRKITLLENQRDSLLSQVHELTLGKQELAAGNDEISLCFFKSLEKLEALQTEYISLSNHLTKARADIGKRELKLHEQARKIDMLETANDSLIRTQGANIVPSASPLNNAYEGNDEIFMLRQTCESLRSAHQRDKQQMLLNMAKMSVRSGEFQKQNAALRNEILVMSKAKSHAEDEVKKRSSLERELVKRLIRTHLETVKLQRHRLESQELLEQSKETMQSVCIEVAFLKETIDELTRNPTNNEAYRVCPGDEGFWRTRFSETRRTSDARMASLQLTERVLAGRSLPLKMTSLRRWHSFAFAKRVHDERTRKSNDLAEKLIETQRKIWKLKFRLEKNADLD
jgi:hypothetical protein